MNDKLLDVPTVDELLANPARAAELSPDVARALLIGLASLHPILIARALLGVGTQAPEPPARLLTVAQVVEQFGVTKPWLYRHKQQLPHSQPSRKVLLFPEDKLQRWFANRKTH